MGMKIFYLMISVLILSIIPAYSQLAVRPMLSEEIIVEDGSKLSVSHLLDPTCDIEDLIIYDRYPDEARPKIDCDCEYELIEGEYIIMKISAKNLSKYTNISYEVDMKPGTYDVVLGHKTYSCKGTGQERLGKTYVVEIEKKDIDLSWAFILIAALIAFIISVRLLLPK